RSSVEAGQDQIDVAEPGSYPVDLARRTGNRDQHEQDAEDDRDQGPADGHSKLRAGALEPTLELRHTAEQPERDRVDLDSFPAGGPRGPGLGERDRGEEGGGGRHG